MKMNLAKLTCFALVAAALSAAPALCRAQDATNAPAAENATPKKQRALTVHGTVSAVDAAAMTFTIKNSTFAITSETKISKEGKPAIFADIAVGQNASVSYKKEADGKLSANSVKIGAKKKATPPEGTNTPAQ